MIWRLLQVLSQQAWDKYCTSSGSVMHMCAHAEAWNWALLSAQTGPQQDCEACHGCSLSYCALWTIAGCATFVVVLLQGRFRL